MAGAARRRAAAWAEATMEQLVSFSLAGQVVVVSGAGRGIGAAIAQACAQQGAALALGSRTLAESQQVAASCGAAGVPAAAFALDVARVAAIEQFVDQVIGHFGRIDVLVNNAGTNLHRPALDYTEAEYDAIAGVNLKGVFFLSTAVARTMRAAGRPGSIITITSQAGVVGAPGRSIYSAAKAGAAHLMRTLAAEWAPYGIRCNAIAPTFTRTPLLEAALAVNPAFAASTATVPLGRIAEPADIAGAVVFLASPAAAMITGQHLAVDGGFTAI